MRPLLSRPQARVRSGPIFVLGLLALGLVAGAGTWWNYTQSNFSTRDAILRVVPPDLPPEDNPAPPALVAEAPGKVERESLREARAEAEIELGLLQENLAAAKEALEQAVVMVREAKENFDFAAERHEKLMPLVETGALEPLAASQIQSAYISARASFATAKFLLAQARQEYGSLEARQLRWELAAGKLARLAAEENTAAESVEGPPPANDEQTPPPAREVGSTIEAWFDARVLGRVLPGQQARISLPSGNPRKLGAIVRQVDPPAPNGQVRVLLQSTSRPGDSTERETWPCQVTIDASLPRVPEPKIPTTE